LHQDLIVICLAEICNQKKNVEETFFEKGLSLALSSGRVQQQLSILIWLLIGAFRTPSEVFQLHFTLLLLETGAAPDCPKQGFVNIRCLDLNLFSPAGP